MLHTIQLVLGFDPVFFFSLFLSLPALLSTSKKASLLSAQLDPCASWLHAEEKALEGCGIGACTSVKRLLTKLQCHLLMK